MVIKCPKCDCKFRVNAPEKEPEKPEDRLKSIEERLAQLCQRMEKNPLPDLKFYTVKQFSDRTGLKEESIRGYLRGGRLNGVKANSGRGSSCGWRIEHAELERFRREGLLPE